MGQRSKLSALLHDAAPHVYFQPSNNLQMEFPCITYERAAGDSKFAGNQTYLFFKRYTVTVIDSDPDSPIVDAVAALPGSRHSTFFVANQLNHDVFDVYF